MTLEEKQLHDKEMSEKFLLREGDITEAEYASLSIQDLCVLLNYANWMLESGQNIDSLEKMDSIKDKNIQIYGKLVAKIRQAPVLYTVIDKATGFSFITNVNDSIWIFSQKEYAEACVEHYKEEHRNFSVQEIENDKLMRYLGSAFFIYGANGIFVDNGQLGFYLRARDLVVQPDWSNLPEEEVPVENPDFMKAHLKFVQEISWKVDYPERQKVLEELEKELVEEMCKARFLIPVLKNADEGTSGESIVTRIATLINGEGKKGMPVFTDWIHFKMIYSEQEYTAGIMNFETLVDVFEKEETYESIVVNVMSCPLNINRNTLQRMQEIANKLM